MTIELVLLARVAVRDREVAGPRVRELLAVLASELRTGCSAGRLIEALWPEGAPEHPAKALQALVFRARTQIGPDVLVSTPRGYRLALNDDQVDATALRLRAAAAARAGGPAAALAEADAGLALWDGAGADAEGALGELRAAATRAHRALARIRALSLARLGRAAEADGPLIALAREHPRDEEILAELLRSEAVVRGPAAALARYEAYRRRLRHELGADPGAALQNVHRELLDTPVTTRSVPPDPNPLIGREQDVAAVSELLRISRVTSVVGPGGLGKTRLAQTVARDAPHRTVVFVPLAGLTADSEVASEVASAVGVGDGGPGAAGNLLGGLADALGSVPTLLVLDNCEHVIVGVTDLVVSLLARSADLRVLTTSRTPLGVSAETVYLLPELTPETSAALFRQRALAVRPGADLPADAVDEVCRHLDGLPLAVELAAARIRVLSVHEIARRLERRLGLLRSGARDTPERHRTLAAVIDWSWHLLAPAGQTAMRMLSVFPGGFTADAAAHVLAVDDALPVLEHLVDQSLLKVSDAGAGVRFRMLETVREFGALRRAEAGEAEQAVERFLSWARGLCLATYGELFGPAFVECVVRLRADSDNLAAALRPAVERDDGATVGAVVAALGGLWAVESNFPRLLGLTGEPARVLSHFRPGPELVEAVRTAAVLIALSAFLLEGTRTTRAQVVLRRLPPTRTESFVGAADAILRAPDFAAVEALTVSPSPLLAGVALTAVSYAAESSGESDAALAAARRALDALGEGGNRWVHAVAHSRVGELEMAAGNSEAARRHMGVVLPVLEDLTAWASVERVRWAMVAVALRDGALDDAQRWLEQIERSPREEQSAMLMFDVVLRAELLRGRGRSAEGLRLWREAAARLRADDELRFPALRPWTAEVQAGAVIAHALDDRLDLVPEIVAELTRILRSITERAEISPAGGAPVGGLLLAIAVSDARRTGHGAPPWSARLIALAERCRVGKGFWTPATLERARDLAGRPAYEAVKDSYTGLDYGALLAAASAVLAARQQALIGGARAGTPPVTTGSRPR